MLKPIPQPAVVKWYRARDVFLGLNGNAVPNYRRGLELAQECKAEPGCEEAAWFCGLCESIDSPFVLDDDNSDDDEYRRNPHKDIPFHAVSQFFMDLASQPGMSHTAEGRKLMGLYAILRETGTVTLTRPDSPSSIMALCFESATAGYPLAMSHLATYYGTQNAEYYNLAEARRWALNAAELGDPRGMWLVYVYDEDSSGVQWVPRAAALGYHIAERNLSETYPLEDPRHFYWLFRAHAGRGSLYLIEEVLMVANPRPHDAYTRSIFQIGSCLEAAKRSGNPDPDPECPLDYPIDICFVLNCSVNPQIEGVFHNIWMHYRACCKDARLAVDAWTMIARRGAFYGVGADMRRMVAERIWDCRVDWHDWEG